MKKWQHNIILMIVAIAINVASRALSDRLGCMLVANQITILSSAYFIGPSFSAILAVLTGIFSGLILKPSYIALALPELAAGITVGLMSRKDRFLENLYHSLSYVCILGTLEGCVLGAMEATFLKGYGVVPAVENYISMFSAYGYFRTLRCFLAGMFTMYPDVFFTIMFSWILHYFHGPFRKKMMRRRYLKRNMAHFMVLTLIMGAAASFAGPATVKAESNDDIRFIQKVYGSEDGLMGGAANDIIQTNEGTIWIATYEGIYRYNGAKFELVKDIPSTRSILSLYVDSGSNMWIGNNGTGLAVTTSDRGILLMDTENGLPSDTITGVTQISDTLYGVATTGGLAIVEYDGTTLKYDKTYNNGSYIEEIASDSNGNLVFTDSNGNAYLLKNGGEEPAMLKMYEDEMADAVAFDPEGRLYIGTGERIYGYESVDAAESFVTLSVSELGGANDMYFTEDGYIYVACEYGLGYFDAQGSFTQIYVEDYNSGIDTVIRDYQGNFWFTSSRYGVLKLERSGIANVFDKYGVEQAVVNASLEWNGYFYAGTDAGLLIFDTEHTKNVENELTEELSGVRIRCLMEDNEGNLWISTAGSGAIEVSPRGDEFYFTEDNGITGNKVRFTTALSDGSVAIACNNGMAIARDHKVIEVYSSDENFISAYPLSICEMENGDLLVGTSGDGVCLLKDKKVVKTYSRSEGLSSGVILRIVRDIFGEGYFVLTGSGMCYMDTDFNFREISGFPYYNNLDMYMAEDGTVLVSSTAGMFITSYDSLMSGDEVSVTLLDTQSGLPGSITSNGWNYVDDDGTFYLAGSTGLYSFDIHDYQLTVDAYKPNISAVMIGGEVLPTTNEKTITIPKGTGEVTFILETNNFTSFDPYVRYYLSGVDDAKTTVKASELGNVVYNHIPSGEHDFCLEMMNEEGGTVVSRNTISIVKETEDFEKTGFQIYFYYSCVVILFTFLLAVTNIATDSVSRKQKRALEKAVADLEKEKAQALELALRHEESANKSKSDFLASMSHEIRTPINAILGMDTMILRESSEDRIRGYAADVKSAGETLLALINDILDFSKIESGKMELVNGDYDMSSVINDLVNMVRPKVEAKHLELQLDVNPDIPAMLYGDEVRVKQIILNILNNAVKYTQEGYVRLSFDFEKVAPGQIALKVSVKDSGIGIKEEDLKKLFSPYERIEEGRNKNIEGTGLGMSITKNLLEMMESNLVVESEYGKGSEFSFSIIQLVKSLEGIGDFKERLKAVEQKVDEGEHFHAPDASILIVDDVEMNLIVAQNLLGRIQVKTKTAPSGAEALKMCQAEHFDLILLDSMMPEMSGEETLKHIKAECELNSETPIIVLTANAVKGAREEYMELGFDNYLSKPIDATKLEAMLQCYLPDELIIPVNGNEQAGENASDNTQGERSPEDEEFFEKIGKIPGIELERGIETAGGEDIYKVVCRNFYDTAAGRIELLEKHYRENDIKNYTIQVHALKSSARLIGAYSLSEKAWEMEQAGRAEDMELIEEKTDPLISEYRNLLIELEGAYENGEDDADKPPIDEEELKGALSEMKELLEAFDFDTAAELFESLSEYRQPDSFKSIGRSIKGKIAEVDTTGIIDIIDSYLEG